MKYSDVEVHTEGKAPLKLLTFTAIHFMLDHPAARKEGIVPLSWLTLIPNVVIAVRVLHDAGMVPVKLLAPTFIVFSAAVNDGRDPLN